jgi:NADH:ubiquinone oxidoreductase subunit E
VSGERRARLPPLTRVGAASESSARRLLLLVCHGPSCSERGGPELLARLEAQAGDAPVRLCRTTCLDHCATGPNVVLCDTQLIQTGMLPERAGELLRLLRPGEPPLRT